MAIGTHRIKNPDPSQEDGVWVTDGKVAIGISESRYISGKYTLPLQTLPWDESEWRNIGGDPEGWEAGMGNYMRRRRTEPAKER